MKRLFTNLVLAVLVLSMFSCSKSENTDSDGLKRYDVKSGIIHYEITISGNNGAGIIQGEGVQDLYFKNWGALELANEERTETSVTTIPFTGQVIRDSKSIHNTVKIDNEMIYSVDYDAKKIFTQKEPLIEFMRLNDYDALEAGKKMLESLGGIQLDNEEFNGYDCEVWSALGSKQWIYKGITLKIITTLAGITITKEATDIKFDVSVSDDYFKLPNFPTTPING